MTDSKREELVDSMARAMFNAVPPPNPSGPRNGYSTQLRILARAALDVFESQPAPAVSGLDLDALEAVAKAATPGPWVTSTTVWTDDALCVDVPDGEGDEVALAWEVGGGIAGMAREDATYVATFDPPTVLALIAAVRHTVREMHARELHHFEEEQLRAKAEAELAAALHRTVQGEPATKPAPVLEVPRDAPTGLGQGEPEWEWALMSDGDDEPWSDYYKTREHLAERCGGLADREDEHLVRRRAPSPWLPVDENKEGD